MTTLDDIYWAAKSAAELNPDGDSEAMVATHVSVVRAIDALKSYKHPDDEPIPDTIVDLLVDLQHLCKGLDISFGDLVGRAVTHFEAEDVDQ